MRELKLNPNNLFSDKTNKVNTETTKGNSAFGNSFFQAKQGSTNPYDTSEKEHTNVNLEEYTPYLGDLFPISDSMNKSRAVNQGHFEQFARTMGKLPVKLGLEFINQLGGMLDVEDWFNTDDEIGNWLSDWATEQKANVDEFAPVYAENNKEHFDTTDLAWWLNNGSGLVESMGAFVALGYLTGGAGLVALKNGANVINFLKGAGKVAELTSKTQKGFNTINTIANAFLLNRAESLGISVNAYNDAYNQKINELSAKGVEGEELEIQAKEYAAKVGRSASDFNLANIALQFTSAKMFLKTPNLTRQVFKAPSLKKSIKNAFIEGGQESIEESINLIAEKQAHNEDYGVNDAINDVFSEEGLESSILGFIGGFGQTAFTNAGRKLKLRKDDKGNKVSDNELQLRAFQKQQDNIKNINKIQPEVSDGFLKGKELEVIYNEIEEKQNSKDPKDITRVQELRSKFISNQAYDAFTTGTTEQLLRVYEGISNLTEEQAVERGFDAATYKEESKKAVKTIESYEKAYENSRQYINSPEVYANKAESIYFDIKVDELNTLKTDLTSELKKHITTLNLKEEDIFTDKGNLKNIKDNNGNLNILKNLPDYQNLKELNSQINLINNKRKSLLNKYSTIVSNEYQTNLKNILKQAKKLKKDDTKNQETVKNKKAQTVSKKSTVKTANTPVEPVTVDTPIHNTKTTSNSVDFQFKSTNNESEGANNLANSLNNIINNNKDLDSKKEELLKQQTKFSSALTSITSEQKKSEIQGTLIQIDNAIDKINELQIQNDIQQNTQNNSNIDLTDAFSQLNQGLLFSIPEKENSKIKEEADRIARNSQNMLNVINLLEKSGYNTDDFRVITDGFLKYLGEDRLKESFTDLRNVYNLVKKTNVNVTYEDYYLSELERRKIIEDENTDFLDNVFKNYINAEDLEIQTHIDDTTKTFLESQGYSVYINDSYTVKNAKIKQGDNKVAYLAKEYNTIIDPSLMKFNVFDFIISKNDINKEINKNTDLLLLSKNGLKENDEITFKVIDEVIYDNGTIVKNDGTIIDSKGERKENPIDIAPIAMFYKGKQVKGAYIHVPKWFSNTTIANNNDIARQVRSIQNIRKKIIEAGSEGITTKIVNISQGHLLVDKDGIRDTLKNNTPNVQIGVGKDNVIYTSEKNTITIPKYDILNGYNYMVIPTRNGSNTTVPFYSNQLGSNPVYVDTILNAVRLHMEGEVTQVTQEIYDKTKINILNIKGLEKYISKLIYLSPYKVKGKSYYKTEDFKTLLENVSDTKSAVRIVNDNIEFGRGADKGGSFGFLNRKILNTKQNKAYILTEQLKKLRNVLENNTRINVDKSLLNQAFTLPILTENGQKVEFKEENYNDFIKENSTTSVYSITLSNGEEIYTVQSNISYDYSFAYKEEIEEIRKDKVDVVKDNNVDIEVVSNDGEDFNINLEDFAEDSDDLLFSPLELTEDVKKEMSNSIPDSLFIKGISLNFQNLILDHLVATILKKTFITKSTKSVENAENFINNFKNDIRRTKDIIKLKASEQPNNEKVQKGAKNYIEKLDIILGNYEKILRLLSLRLKNINKIDSVVVYKKTKDDTITKRVKELKITKINSTKRNIDEDLYAYEDIDISEEQEESVINQSNWANDDTFREDSKRKMSNVLRNVFSYIEDATINSNGDIVTKKAKFLGIPKIVPADEVLNELNAILAYNNQGNQMYYTFEEMLNVLETWVDKKPFIRNVIDTLNTVDNSIKKEFVQVMSKHYNHHIYVYKNKKGTYFVNDSDNNAISKSIVHNWVNNILDSDLVQKDKGEFIFNAKEIDKLLKLKEQLITLLKSDNVKKLDFSHKLLKDFGFNFSKPIVNKLLTTGLKIKGKDVGLMSLLTASDGAINLYLQKLENLKGKSFDNTTLFDDSAIYTFAKALGKYSPTYFAQSFKDVRGRLYFAYSNNKFLVSRINALKNDKSLLHKLSKQPFSKNSSFVNNLLNNEKFQKYFEYFTFDGLSSFDTAKGSKPENSSARQIEEVKLALFFNRLKENKKDYIIRLFYPTTSNKTVQYGLQVLGRDWAESMVKDNLQKDQLFDLFDALIKPEILRMQQYEIQGNINTTKGYSEGANMFHFIPELNTLKSIRNADGSLKVDILTNLSYKKEMLKIMNTFIANLVQDKIDYWDKLNLTTTKETDYFGNKYIETVLKVNGEDVKESAFNYVINYLTANANIFQTFITDPAFYWKSSQWKTVLKNKNVLNKLIEDGYAETIEEASDFINSLEDKRGFLLDYYSKEDWIAEHNDVFNNIGKRLAGDAGPGLDIPGSANDTFTLGIIDDNERKSAFYDYYGALLGKGQEDYAYMNSTDAQEFTTLKEHLHLLYEQGKIKKEDIKRIIDADNSNTLSDIDLSIVFQPMKPIYVNNIWINGIEQRLYVKSSSFPLFKSLTKNLKIDKLRVKMENEGIDRLAFTSAVKIGGLEKPAQLFDNEGNVQDVKITKLNTAIPRQGHRIQQDVPYDENVATINAGTQEIVLLTANMLNIDGFKLRDSETLVKGKEIRDRLDIAYGKIYDISYNKLIKELKFDENTNSIDISKLSKILIEEGIKRNYSVYDLEALKVIKNKNGKLEFKVPLWQTGVTGKIEAMLNSIIDNRIRKIKLPGKSYVLGTSEGITPVYEGDLAQEFINNTTGIKWDKEWYKESKGQLAPMHIVDANGNLLGTPNFNQETSYVKYAEIVVPFKFKDDNGNVLKVEDFVDDDNFIDTTKLPKDLLKLFGFRIPTQNLNSMSAIKIVGFLPKKSGDLLLAPAEWTVQMGSDFDVDKLYSNKYNTSFDKNTNTLSLYKGENELKQLQNEVLDLHFSVLGNPNPLVQKEIAKMLDFGELPNLINNVYKGESKGIGLSESYQSWKYLNARAGKAGIGVFSSDNIFLASAESKNMYLTETVVDKKGNRVVIPFIYTINGKTNLALSDSNTVTKNKTKIEVNNAFQSLAVDDENEQGLFKLNINEHTFDFIRTMVASGFEEKDIVYILKQPIITEYAELLSINKDNREYDIDKALLEKFPNNDVDLDISSETYEADFQRKYLDTNHNSLIHNMNTSNLNTTKQLAILNLFKKLSNYGKSIQTIQSAINPHSAGLGKDIFYSTTKEQQVYSLQYNSKIANVANLVGTFQKLNNVADTSKITNPYDLAWNNAKTDKEKQEVIDDLKSLGFKLLTIPKNNNDFVNTVILLRPETIKGHAIVNALNLNNKLWSNFFPYNHSVIQSFFKDYKFINNIGSKLEAQAEANKRAFSIIKRFISSNSTIYTNNDIKSERERLFINTIDNTSLAHIVHKLINEDKLNNPFINRLTIELKTNTEPSLLKYNASIVENIDERNIFASFVEMFEDSTTILGEFNGITYTPFKLAQDLVTSQLLSGGIQSPINFVKYIPINYLTAIGYYKYVSNLNFNNENDFNLHRLKLQYIQHNPHLVELNEVQLEDFNNNYKKYNGGLIITVKPKHRDSLPKLFSIKDNSSVSGYSLYNYNSNNKSIEKISTLGTKHFTEYDINSDNVTSVIEENKLPENRISLPSDKIKAKELVTTTPKLNGTQLIDANDKFNISTYNINNEITDKQKIHNILETIIENNFNGYHTTFAKELLKVNHKFDTLKVIITPKKGLTGMYNATNHILYINPDAFNSNLKFEKVVLEELIHSVTANELKNNSKLNDKFTELREFAKKEMSKHFKNIKSLGDFDAQYKDVERKLKALREGADNSKGEYSITPIQAKYIYPLLENDEFVARLFKSKEIREILNKADNTSTKSLLEKIFNFFINALKSVGIDIRKGSKLEEAFLNIVRTMHSDTKAADEDITVSVDRLEALFNLRDSNGFLNEVPASEAEVLINWINHYISNVNAEYVDGFIVLETIDRYVNEYEERRKAELKEEIKLRKENLDSIPEYIIVTNLPKITPESAIKETGGKVGVKQDINPSYLNKNGISIEKAAENIKADHFENNEIIDESFIRDTIIDILSKTKSEYIKNITGEDGQLSLFNIPEETKVHAKYLMKAYKNRLNKLKISLNKAKATENDNRVILLEEQIEDVNRKLTESRLITSLRDRSNSTSDIYYKGIEDLNEVEEMLNRELYIEDTLYIRKVVHFWEKSINVLFNEEDKKSDVLIKDFSELQNKAERLKSKLIKKETDFMNSFMNKYGQNITIDELFKHFTDINGLQRRTMDISRSNNELLNSVFLAVKNANIDAKNESDDILEDLAELESEILPILENMGESELYEVFRQRTKNGNLTGHLVQRLSPEFLKRYNGFLRHLRNNNDSLAFESLLTWGKENIQDINLKLFTKKDADGEAYRAELKAKLGDLYYEEFATNQEALIVKYKNKRKAKLQAIATKHNVTFKHVITNLNTNYDYNREFSNWDAVNSPFMFYNYMNGGLPKRLENFNNFRNTDYVHIIPKNNTAFDSNYKKIEENPSLLKFYKYYTKVDSQLRTYLPSDARRSLAYKGIPYLEKTILDLYKDKGMKVGLTALWDNISKSVRTIKENPTINTVIDPVTNKAEDNLTVKFHNNDSEIHDYVSAKIIEYKLNYNKQPDYSLIDQWREEIIDEKSQNKTFDLAKVLRVYTMTTMAFKHKSKIEDTIKLAQNVLYEQKEYERTNAGEFVKDDITNQISDPKNPENSFIELKTQFDHFVDKFMGKGSEEEGVTDTKVLTKTEKEQIKEYNDLLAELEVKFTDGKITSEAYKADKEVLENLIHNLGGYAVWSKRGDNALKWVQLVKMGWNIMSGIANTGFGYIANRIEGAGGKLYTNEQLTKAYRMTTNSILKNLSFNQYENDTAKKIRSLMDNWDVLKDSTHEIYQNPYDITLGKKLEFLTPYNVTQRTEYINQAPLMIAMMMNTKLSDMGIDSEDTLWDAYTVDGVWNSSKYGEINDDINNKIKFVQIKLDQLNKMNHGNYDPISSLQIKSNVIGRAVSQFRTWMFEGYAVRFEGYKNDALLGERKGRYRSYTDFFKENGFGTTAIETLKGLVRSLTLGTIFKNSDFESFNSSNLKEVDIANMRKVMTELTMYITLFTSFTATKLAAAELDDDDETKFVLNLLTNQGMRLKTDIMFYLHPGEFKNLLRDLVPATSLITDSISFLSAVGDFAIGEDEIGSGIYAGNSRLLRETAQMLPIGTQIYKTINYGVQVFDK